MIFSSDEPAKVLAPVSTLIPGCDPTLEISSGIFFLSDDICLIVSSYKITPPIQLVIHDDFKRVSLNSNLFSGVGSHPGIKVDTGAKTLAGSIDEKITEGLDGLRERLKEYDKLVAKFTKWRGVYNITKTYPSKLCIHSNAHALARYSALVQECNMVPIVEPEVLMDGEHSAKDCLEKTSEVIKKCFDELILNKVDLKGIILKPNMILAGNKCKDQISSEEVAKLTLECLNNSVPTEVPGIAFLSGGQTELQSTENLNLINKLNTTNFIMSYSYGRALQQSALKFWSKNIQDIKGTQKVFNHRAKMNTLAAQGKWSRELEN